MNQSPLPAGFKTEQTGADAGVPDCVYCQTKVLHPRLGRGETYACGYKPYRCEICNYSTITKGNLTIHEQSDKHLNNRKDHEQYQIPRRSSASANQPNISTILLQSSSSFTRTTCCAVDDSPASPATADDDSMFQNLLEMSESPLFCRICATFITDSVDDLIRHAEENRLPMDLDLANQQVTTQLPGGLWHCLLCAYQSPLKANFQLHCRTEKHTQKLSLLVHVCDGRQGDIAAGRGGLLAAIGRLPSVAGYKGSGVIYQLGCLACGYVTCSTQNMRIHCQQPAHRLLAGVFCVAARKRQNCVKATLAAGVHRQTASATLKCPGCELAFASMATLMRHFKTSHVARPTDGFITAGENHALVPWQTECGGFQPAQKCQLPEGVPFTCENPYAQESHADIKGDITPDVMHDSRLAGLDLSSNGKPGSIGSLEENVQDGSREAQRSVFSAPPIRTLVHEASPAEQPNGSQRDYDERTAPSDVSYSPAASLLNIPIKRLRDTVNPTTNEYQTSDFRARIVAELLEGLKAFNKREMDIPRTPENLFSWLGFDLTFVTSLKLLLRSRLSELGDPLLDGFTGLAIELTAQEPQAPDQRFNDLHKLQQYCSQSTCHQCCPARGFVLPSSATLHATINHHSISFPFAFSVNQMVATVRETLLRILLFVPHTKDYNPEKTFEKLETEKQIEILTSHFNRNAYPSDKNPVLGRRERLTKPMFRSDCVNACKPSAYIQHKFDSTPTSAIPEVVEATNQISHLGKHNQEASIGYQPTKRLRTTISNQQHALLSHFFKEEQNPSRGNMDLISEKVGLPKRVVQVWFQNARSRERKMRQSTHFPNNPEPTELPVSNCSSETAQQGTPLPTDPMYPSKIFQDLFNQFVAINIPPLGLSSFPHTDAPLDLTKTPTDNNSSNGQSSGSPRSECCSLTPITPLEEAASRPQGFARRNRTTINAAQVRFLQSIFANHRTPVISECDEIGRVVGLTRRVVQVWFQNQRAKEKKLARMSLKGDSADGGNHGGVATEGESLHRITGSHCHLCRVEIKRGNSINEESAIIDHIFSSTHMTHLLNETTRTDRWSETDPCVVKDDKIHTAM